jgi:hypothetical protein
MRLPCDLSWKDSNQMKLPCGLSWKVPNQTKLPCGLSWKVPNQTRLPCGLSWKVPNQTRLPCGLSWKVLNQTRLPCGLSWKVPNQMRLPCGLRWKVPNQTRRKQCEECIHHLELNTNLTTSLILHDALLLHNICIEPMLTAHAVTSTHFNTIQLFTLPDYNHFQLKKLGITYFS